jgi:hypothetical protein
MSINSKSSKRRPLSSSVTRSLPFWLLCSVGLLAACGKKGSKGIEECDKYFKTVESCANEDEKSSLKSAADIERDAWEHLGAEEVKASCVERAKYVKERCDVGPDGVAACDDYFKLVDGCKEGPGKATQQANAKDRRADWKSMPKSQLEKTCKMNVEMAEKFCK